MAVALGADRNAAGMCTCFAGTQAWGVGTHEAAGLRAGGRVPTGTKDRCLHSVLVVVECGGAVPVRPGMRTGGKTPIPLAAVRPHVQEALT